MSPDRTEELEQKTTPHVHLLTASAVIGKTSSPEPAGPAAPGPAGPAAPGPAAPGAPGPAAPGPHKSTPMGPCGDIQVH